MIKDLKKLASVLNDLGYYSDSKKVHFIIRKFSQQETYQQPSVFYDEENSRILGAADTNSSSYGEFYGLGYYSQSNNPEDNKPLGVAHGLAKKINSFRKPDGTTLNNVVFFYKEEWYYTEWNKSEIPKPLSFQKDFLPKVMGGANLKDVILLGNDYLINGPASITDCKLDGSRIIGSPTLNSCEVGYSTIYEGSNVSTSRVMLSTLDGQNNIRFSKINAIGIKDSDISNCTLHFGFGSTLKPDVDSFPTKIFGSTIHEVEINSLNKEFIIQNSMISNSRFNFNQVLEQIFNSDIKNVTVDRCDGGKILNATLDNVYIISNVNINIGSYSGNVILQDCTVYGGYIYGDARLVRGGGSHAYIAENAKIYGNAIVSGGVRGNAEVYGNAKIFSGVEVSGTAKVYGNAILRAGNYTSGEYTSGVWDGPQQQLNWRDARPVIDAIEQKMNKKIEGLIEMPAAEVPNE